jgi:hypothetical protein
MQDTVKQFLQTGKLTSTSRKSSFSMKPPSTPPPFIVVQNNSIELNGNDVENLNTFIPRPPSKENLENDAIITNHNDTNLTLIRPPSYTNICDNALHEELHEEGSQKKKYSDIKEDDKLERSPQESPPAASDLPLPPLAWLKYTSLQVDSCVP